MSHKNIEILRTLYLRGPSIWTYRPIIEALIESITNGGGFSEELLTRGLTIVGARGAMHEKWVWAFSGLVFGLIHVPNIVFGQAVGPTLQQVVFAFAVGLTYYVTRRIAGTLIVTMLLSLRTAAPAGAGACAGPAPASPRR